MAEEETLNKQNARPLQGFLVANVALFVAELGAAGLPSWDVASFKAAVGTLLPWAVVGPIAVTVLLGVIPEAVTEFLLFWRVKRRLPSYRAFARLSRLTDLADPERLKGHLNVAQLPTSPEAQSQAWYRLYQQFESKPAVRDTHRRYLLMRDATALALLCILVLLPTLLLVAGPPAEVALTYLGALLAQVVLLALAGRRYGHKLVVSVLRVASHN